MTPLERAAEKVANILRNMGVDTPEDISQFFVIAVLQAIREPSEAMLDAACQADGGPRPNPEAVLHWQAMIDAALEEG